MSEEHQLSAKSRQEVIEKRRHRYLHGSRQEKTRILDELEELTGRHRKHLTRVLKHGYKRTGQRRGRPRAYRGETVRQLVKIWRIYGCICGKRLQPFLAEGIEVLERHQELELDEETRAELLKMSAATIDRYLKAYRDGDRRGKTTTRPGVLLKHSIPIRTFADWDEARPGFVEMDLVAHCGPTTAGYYLNTLTAVDVCSGWTECLVLPHRTGEDMVTTLTALQQQFPVRLRGIDCDNDGLFINKQLKAYCEKNKLTFTRSRPYKKNDQAFVEQKNGDVVRRYVGYGRYNGPLATPLFEQLYADLRLYVNFFQPVRKLVFKERRGATVHKQYDLAQTPYRRLLSAPKVSRHEKLRLSQMYLSLNPVELQRRIGDTLKKLWQIAE
jgi:hypothetical protein